MVDKKLKKAKTIAEVGADIEAESNSNLELKIFNLSNALANANQIIEQKNVEIEELKKHLNNLVPALDKVTKLSISDEEVIANIQLAKLKDQATQRPLSLEEIKMFDLLVKNKRIAQGDANDVIDVKGLPKNLPQADLLKIASHTPKKK